MSVENRVRTMVAAEPGWRRIMADVCTGADGVRKAYCWEERVVAWVHLTQKEDDHGMSDVFCSMGVGYDEVTLDFDRPSYSGSLIFYVAPGEEVDWIEARKEAEKRFERAEAEGAKALARKPPPAPPARGPS